MQVAVGWSKSDVKMRGLPFLLCGKEEEGAASTAVLRLCATILVASWSYSSLMIAGESCKTERSTAVR